jgi:hypothetical protein
MKVRSTARNLAFPIPKFLFQMLKNWNGSFQQPSYPQISTAPWLSSINSSKIPLTWKGRKPPTLFQKSGSEDNDAPLRPLMRKIRTRAVTANSGRKERQNE